MVKLYDVSDGKRIKPEHIYAVSSNPNLTDTGIDVHKSYLLRLINKSCLPYCHQCHRYVTN